MGSQDQQKDVQNALEANLRLHPQQIELGQAEMLTDALLNKFDDLEQRLNTYISGASGGEKLRKGMQSYLSRLNANPLIPLHFRLKVLKRFEGQLDLFDAEMTAAILNAHKIGIDMVQKEAQAEAGYYPILVDMISHAIELAGRLMRDGLAEYQTAAIITIRQVFDLMRLGMVILPECPETVVAERKRFYRAVARYELLRNLDFFSLTDKEQAMVMDELKHHIQILEPYYLAKGAVKSADLKGYSLMATNLSRPHETAKVLPFAPNSSATDHLLIPMDDFIDKLVLSIDRAEKVLKDPLLQSKNLQVEAALNTTVVGGNAILDALRTKSRIHERQEYGNAKMTVDWGLVDLMAVAIEENLEEHGVVALGSEAAAAPILLRGSEWTVLNISKSGIAIERISMEAPSSQVGHMVGLNWTPYRGEPRFAFIRWIRYPKPGEQQMGLDFYMQKHVVLKAVMLSIGDTSEYRKWPVLVSFEEGNEHTMLFPDGNIFTGLVFSIQRGVQKDLFKVLEILDQGANYSLCVAGEASELDTQNVDSGSK
ncbi:MAG: hypothetical protein COB79_01620 [Zetaproteobacteria bacterium]|nr:MAG: hypothetical protein COB79_01620 [Zetaproteobacteria bacterium]